MENKCWNRKEQPTIIAWDFKMWAQVKMDIIMPP